AGTGDPAAGRVSAAGRTQWAGGPLRVCTTAVTISDHDEVHTHSTVFLAAGAATVVASLWAVPDDTPPHLMYAFHHHLLAQGWRRRRRCARLSGGCSSR